MALTPQATIEAREDGLTVAFDWGAYGVDRPRTYAISTGAKHALAERLVAANDGGALWSDERVARDLNGKTYVAATCRVGGRTLNADLRRLGY